MEYYSFKVTYIVKLWEYSIFCISFKSKITFSLYNNLQSVWRVDSVFDKLGFYSEGDIATNQVETENIYSEEFVDMDVSAEASDVEAEEELPWEPKKVICEKGKGNHIINSITGNHFQNNASEKCKIEVTGSRNCKR